MPAAGVSVPTRVFVCAHSFMIFTSRLLPAMAGAAGFRYASAGQQMIGGSRVIQHWNLPDDKNLAKAALREGNVDVLTLSPNMQMPDEGIDLFVNLALKHRPDIRVLGVLPQSTVAGRTGTAAAADVVSVGKRLNQNLQLTYEQGLADAEGALKITWRISQHFQVLARAGYLPGLDAVYRWTFK